MQGLAIHTPIRPERCRVVLRIAHSTDLWATAFKLLSVGPVQHRRKPLVRANVRHIEFYLGRLENEFVALREAGCVRVRLNSLLHLALGALGFLQQLWQGP